MQITEVSALTELTRRAIRLYEEQGLIRVGRSRANRRDYDPCAVERLQLIAILRKAGLSLTDIKCILRLRDHEPSASTAAAVALERLEGEAARVRTLLECIEAAAGYVRRALPQATLLAAE